MEEKSKYIPSNMDYYLKNCYLNSLEEPISLIFLSNKLFLFNKYISPLSSFRLPDQCKLMTLALFTHKIHLNHRKIVKSAITVNEEGKIILWNLNKTAITGKTAKIQDQLTQIIQINENHNFASIDRDNYLKIWHMIYENYKLTNINIYRQYKLDFINSTDLTLIFGDSSNLVCQNLQYFYTWQYDENGIYCIDKFTEYPQDQYFGRQLICSSCQSQAECFIFTCTRKMKRIRIQNQNHQLNLSFEEIFKLTLNDWSLINQIGKSDQMIYRHLNAILETKSYFILAYLGTLIICNKNGLINKHYSFTERNEGEKVHINYLRNIANNLILVGISFSHTHDIRIYLLDLEKLRIYSQFTLRANSIFHRIIGGLF